MVLVCGGFGVGGVGEVGCGVGDVGVMFVGFGDLFGV